MELCPSVLVEARGLRLTFQGMIHVASIKVMAEEERPPVKLNCGLAIITGGQNYRCQKSVPKLSAWPLATAHTCAARCPYGITAYIHEFALHGDFLITLK